MHIYDDTFKHKKFLFFFCTEVDKNDYYIGYAIDSQKEIHNVKIPENVYQQIPKSFKNNPHLGYFYHFSINPNGKIVNNLYK